MKRHFFRKNKKLINIILVLNVIIYVTSIAYFGCNGLLNAFEESGNYFCNNHGNILEVSKFGYYFTFYHTLIVFPVHCVLQICILLFGQTPD